MDSINPWWDDKNFRYKTKNRKQYLDKLDNTDLIEVLIGARRVGKTSILRSQINKLLKSGISPSKILYITSEIRELENSRIDELVENFRNKFKTKNSQKIYLLIDEVQNIDKWQKQIKFLYDNTNIKIYLTGSSSLILKPETSKLTGRFTLHEVLPLSFSEYLKFKKEKTGGIIRNNNLLNDYLETGGYPEYVLTRNISSLHNAIESTLYRDLLSVYGIRNPIFLKNLLDYLADKVTTPVSANLISKDLKVSDQTAAFYLDYLENVYLIYPVYKYGSSHKITKGSVPKYYLNDTGVLFNRSLNKKFGLLAENAVYLHLRRKAKSSEFSDIYYHVEGEQEIDFYFKDTDEYFEVKFKNKIEEAEYMKYSFDYKTKILLLNRKKIGNYRLAYPAIEPQNLSDFLLT